MAQKGNSQTTGKVHVRIQVLGGRSPATQLDKPMKLNSNKTEIFWISGKADLGLENSSVLDGIIIPLNSQVHSVGVLLETVVTLEN